MGALVGGLYAAGWSPAALDSIVTGLDWTSYFLDEPERRFLPLDRRTAGERTIVSLPLEDWRVSLPAGVVDGQRVSELLARLTWRVQTVRDFRELPIPFVATATDIETGAAVVLDGGSLAEALRASMSIPSVFEPVRLDGRLLVDGGISRNLPARDARALGADILVCSDVTNPLFPASRLESLVDVLRQTIAIYMNASNEGEKPLCDIYLQPSMEGLTGADFDETPALIQRGRDAAGAARPALRELAARIGARSLPARGAAAGDDSAARDSAARREAGVPDTVRIAGIAVEGVGGEAERSVRRRLRLSPGDRVTAERLDAAVERVYATELYDLARYRLDTAGADTIAVVTVIPREQDHVGFGLRYDDAYRASLLFTVRMRNRIGFGSTTQLDLRLGEQLRVAVQHANVGIRGSRLTAGAGASYSRTPLPIYEEEELVAEARVEVSNVTAIAGVLLGDAGAAGIELKGEHARAATTIAPDDTAQRRTFGSAALVLLWNSLDRTAFPTRGAMLSLRSEHAVAGDRFAQHVGSATVALPLARRLSLVGRATVGASSPGDAVPVHYRFVLGGAFPAPLFPETQVALVGLRHQERSGTAVARAGATLQWEPRRGIFATLRSDVGFAGPELTLDREAYDAGVAVGAGAMTLVGPVELSVAWRPGHGGRRVEASVGYPF